MITDIISKPPLNAKKSAKTAASAYFGHITMITTATSSTATGWFRKRKVTLLYQYVFFVKHLMWQ